MNRLYHFFNTSHFSVFFRRIGTALRQVALSQRSRKTTTVISNVL